jgi:hypothetical protein
MAAKVVEYFPITHSKHSLDPGSTLYLPAAQEIHVPPSIPV